MRVLYLTQWFEPEPIMKGIEFAKGLEAEGFHVEVATGLPNYPLGRLYPGYRWRLFQTARVQGLRVDRLALYPSHDRSTLRRSANYLSFFVSSLAYCLARGRSFDAVYVYHPPITVGLAAALAGFITCTPFILDIQDLWPDSIGASGMANGGTGRITRILRALCNFTYRRAAHVVAQSKGMRETLVARGVPSEKVSVVFNWAPGEDQPAAPVDLAPYGFKDRFNFVFAGAMGAGQKLDVLIEAARIAATAEQRIQLVLVGNGTESAALTASLKAGDPVRILGAIPQAEVKSVLAAADVLTVHLKDMPLYRSTIPSKTQFYLARGKPVLAAVNGETGNIIARLGAGRSAPAGDVEGIAEVMIAMARLTSVELQEMGDRARRGYDDLFSFPKAIASTASVLRQLAPIKSAGTTE